MEITLQDIADELKLSAATVSRSLRHDRLINPETRARVNEAARHMGYTGRVRKPRRPVEHETKSSVLGLLVRHSSLEAAHHDANLMKMMAGIMSVTDEHKMHLKVHSRPAQERRLMEADASVVPPMIQDGECQALIAHGDQDERDLAFLANRMPVVSIGRYYRSLPIDAAVGDNVEGVYQLVTRLMELGHRRLAWVGAYYNSTFLEDRKTGFIKGCLTHGLELDKHLFFGPEIYQKPDIHDKDALLAAANAGVTGFVCGNDGIAMRVIKILEDAGRRVPDDVSVTGFDAMYTSQGGNGRQPTSVDPGFFEIGKVAARLALQRMAHPMDQSCIVNVRGKIVIGDTIASALQTP